MTPVCHTKAPPHLPGGLPCGKRPHDYGRGRVCTGPGCTTILRRTHKGPICDPCQDNRRCGPLASVHDEAVTSAAPAVRATKEEATVPRDEIHNRCEDVLEIMRDGRWWTAAELGERLGVSRQRVHTMTKQLREAGHIIESVAGVGTRLTREASMRISSEVEKSAKTAPATSPAPAPAPMTGVPLGTEQPADVAPAPAPETPLEPVPAAALRPFAGIITSTFIGDSMSGELRILDNLEQLDDDARERVLQYAVDRWWLK